MPSAGTGRVLAPHWRVWGDGGVICQRPLYFRAAGVSRDSLICQLFADTNEKLSCASSYLSQSMQLPIKASPTPPVVPNCVAVLETCRVSKEEAEDEV